MLEGGKSRVFVEISGKVPVNESASDSELSLHLSGVSVPEKVNRLALPTTHFSTPVKRIRVQQAGDGADVIIELRAKVGHQTKLRPIPFGTRLTIEFPRLPEQAEVAIGVPIRPDRPDAGMRPVTAGDPFETE
jgi:hypothetical protein